MTERLRKGEWEVRTVAYGRALDAITAWHYARGAANTAVLTTGLFRRDDDSLYGATH